MSNILGVSGASVATATAATAGQTSALAIATAALGSNKYMLGLMIILINIGARYIGSELTDFQHKVLSHKFARRFLIFLVIWMGTRDLVVAIVLTASFIVLVNGLFNENSRFCILPKSGTSGQSNISADEYQIAKRVVDKYEKEHPNGPIGSLPNFTPSFTPNINTQQQSNIPKNINLAYPIELQKPQTTVKKLEVLNPRIYYGIQYPTTELPKGY